MHLDEHRIQLLLDRELSPSDASEAERHVAGCSTCRARFDEAERTSAEIDRLLTRLDHPLPPISVDHIVARARARESGWGRRAAGIILAVGLAGIAYAAPGSPLKQWVATFTERAADAREEAQQPASPRSSPPAPGAGVALHPGDDFVILVPSPLPAGVARVSIGAGDEIVVRSIAGSASFTSDPGRMTIEDASGDARFEIQVPAAAPRVEIRVGERIVFMKAGSRVTVDAPADSAGRYYIPLR